MVERWPCGARESDWLVGGLLPGVFWACMRGSMLTGENLTWQGCRELFRVGARSGAVLSSRLACGSRLKQQEALLGEEADHGAHAGGGLTYSLGLYAQVGVRGRCRWFPDRLGETAMQALCAGGKAEKQQAWTHEDGLMRGAWPGGCARVRQAWAWTVGAYWHWAFLGLSSRPACAGSLHV